MIRDSSSPVLANIDTSTDMNDTIKMPGGGYDVKVVRKEEILRCIDSNILDKDIMLAFINQFDFKTLAKEVINSLFEYIVNRT